MEGVIWTCRHAGKVKSQGMVDAVNIHGGKAKLTIYTGINHGSWVNAYEDNQIFDWFITHTNERQELEK